MCVVLADVQFQRGAGAGVGLFLLDVTVADRGQQDAGHSLAGKLAARPPLLSTRSCCGQCDVSLLRSSVGGTPVKDDTCVCGRLKKKKKKNPHCIGSYIPFSGIEPRVFGFRF